MSKWSEGVVRRAALWLPVLFCGMRMFAQTSGLAAPVLGDCALNSSGGAVTCTKSNGVALGALATQNSVLPAQMPATVTNYMPALTPVAVDGGGAEYPMLDGSGTTVADVSGNGHNGTLGTGVNAPAWLPYGGLGFNDAVALGGSATGQYVQTPLTTWASVEAYVCMPTLGQNSGTGALRNPGQQFPTMWGSSNFSSGVNALFSGSAAFQQYGVSAYPTTFVNGTSTFNAQSMVPYGNCHVYTFTLGADQDRAYVDGVENLYTGTGRSAASAGTTGAYLIGMGGSATITAFHGTIRYLKVWGSTVLTSQQVLTDSTYVLQRVGARVTTPKYPVLNGVSVAVNESIIGRVVCAGDSLTASFFGGSGPTWCDALATNATYYNESWGVSGSYMVDIDRSAEMRWLSRLNGASVVVIGGGSNDAATGANAASTWNAMRSAIAKARAAGAKQVYYWTLPSRNGADSARDAVNALYRANAATSGGVLVDIAGIPTIGADGANANTACFVSDRVHLTGPANSAGSCVGSLTGYGVVAKYISNAINEAEGSSASSPDMTVSNAYVESAANRFVIQTPTAAATHQIFDCLALTGHTRTVVNESGSFPITMSGMTGQTIGGNTTVAPNATAVFTSELLSSTAGGCFWLRTQ